MHKATEGTERPLYVPRFMLYSPLFPHYCVSKVSVAPQYFGRFSMHSLAHSPLRADLAGTRLIISSLYPTTQLGVLGVGPFKVSMACLDLCINRRERPQLTG